MKKVLVVEDDPSMRSMMDAMLNRSGYTCDIAVNGIEALRLIEENQYCIVFMDIFLPGIDGIETMKEIKQLRPEIPVVAVTAYVRSGLREALFKEGFNEYITKPFQFEMIDSVLQNILHN
ncbi:MAG: response regulator [bacterium]|nr:response regulator [bacterium]